MKELIKTLSHKKTGFGHFEISIVIDGKNFDTTTNDTMAIDAAFDESYDDQENNEERWFESRSEAQEVLVNEILAANQLSLTNKKED